jgi:hypothetical protein
MAAAAAGAACLVSSPCRMIGVPGVAFLHGPQLAPVAEVGDPLVARVEQSGDRGERAPPVVHDDRVRV